jgi:predicted nuclease with TOPRIM domain
MTTEDCKAMLAHVGDRLAETRDSENDLKRRLDAALDELAALRQRVAELEEVLAWARLAYDVLPNSEVKDKAPAIVRKDG